MRETAGVGLETMRAGVEVSFGQIWRSVAREVTEFPDAGSSPRGDVVGDARWRPHGWRARPTHVMTFWLGELQRHERRDRFRS